jgi:hypothetical protein
MRTAPVTLKSIAVRRGFLELIERQGASMKRSCITQRGFVLLLVVSTFGPALYAGFKPEQHVIVQSETNGASCVYAADLDGDGDIDVLSASFEDGKIAWYANDGSGHFGPQRVITTEAAGARCVYAADLDGDGDLDVLSASYGDIRSGGHDSKIAWYANDGSGHFGSEQVITTEVDGANSVYAADLDGDGDLDVLSASASYPPSFGQPVPFPSDNKIAWYVNDGSGHFGSQQVITREAVGASSVYAADLDGDGDLDVLSASSWGGVAWYANKGLGHFGPQQVISTTAIWAESVYAADLDGDGDMDVLSVSSGDSKVAWYANDGSGHFGSQQVITAAASWARSVRAADLDGDGDLDVVSVSYRGIAWHANDGLGHFGPQLVISAEAVGARSVYTADLDGDGDPDVLSASPDDDKIAWYRNDGSGLFGSQAAISTSVAGANHVYAADLDGDGDLDVLSASYDDGEIAWYANDGSGHFGVQQVISTTLAGASFQCVADLDGDGDLDVLSTSGWYANDGLGHFGSQQVITTAAKTERFVHVADLDGDGDLDVLSTSGWYANDGLGHFGPQRVITAVAETERFVYAADLDGDGDVDVLSAWSTGYPWYAESIAWYANDGLGHFGVQQVITTEVYGLTSIYTADLDGDGDVDVLKASYDLDTDNSIVWYANDGSGHFVARQVIDSLRANCVYAADLDGDGDLDVLSASSYVDPGSRTWEGCMITWYANDGFGQFGSQQVITAAVIGAQCVYAADLDGDGDLDVLSASSGDDKIAWYENE